MQDNKMQDINKSGYLLPAETTPANYFAVTNLLFFSLVAVFVTGCNFLF